MEADGADALRTGLVQSQCTELAGAFLIRLTILLSYHLLKHDVLNTRSEYQWLIRARLLHFRTCGGTPPQVYRFVPVSARPG